MPGYSYAALADAIARLFEAVGLPPADARLCGDWLTDAEAAGVTSHGIARVSMYLDALRRGKIATRPAITVEQSRPGVLLVDGGNGMGPVVGAVAIDRAMTAASATGIAIATVRRSNHYGAAGYLLRRAARAGYAAFTCSNGSPVMAVWGGAEPLLGTNPLASSFPAAQARDALSFDMATSVAAFGRIRQAQRRGETIPDDWALAADGTATTDPAAAIGGALLPFGGAKGSALALMAEMLAGVLSGAAIGPVVGNPNDVSDAPADVGHAFIVLDPEAFMPRAAYEARVHQLGDLVRGSRPAAGVDAVRMPGGGASARREDAGKRGISLPKETAGLLEKELRSIGLDLPAPIPSAII
jgi:LDH2 family malate/lactate/ureidoglycolate dehydrogenase